MKIVNIEADKLLKSQPSISQFMPKFTNKEVCIPLCKRKGKKKRFIYHNSFCLGLFSQWTVFSLYRENKEQFISFDLEGPYAQNRDSPSKNKSKESFISKPPLKGGRGRHLPPIHQPLESVPISTTMQRGLLISGNKVSIHPQVCQILGSSGSVDTS